MSYKIECKLTPKHAWTNWGEYSTDDGAACRASSIKAEHPESLIHIFETKTGCVVMSL